LRVLIVDDDALIRDGLKIILENEEDFEVVGTASNGEEAVRLCKVTNPDVVLMDIRMPIMDGVEATRIIKEQFSSVKVLLLTTFKDIEYIRRAVKNGAEGYVLKSNSSESILESIRAVHKGNVVFQKEVAKIISDMMDKNNKVSPMDLKITDREHKLMELVAEGLSNREIAEKLYMSEGTIRNNISTLLDKLELRDRTQLAIFYIRKLEK